MGSARAPPKPVTVPPPTQGGTCCTFTLHALLWYLISYNAGMWCIITRGKKKKSWIWAILGSLITGQGRHHGPGLESGETFLKYRVVLEKKSKTRKSASTDNSRVLTLKQHHEFKEADKTKQNKKTPSQFLSQRWRNTSNRGFVLPSLLLPDSHEYHLGTGVSPYITQGGWTLKPRY